MVICTPPTKQWVEHGWNFGRTVPLNHRQNWSRGAPNSGCVINQPDVVVLVWPRAAHQLNELFINHLKVQTSAGPGWCKGWQRWMAPRLSRRHKTRGGVQTYPSSPYPAKVFWKSLLRGVRGENRWQSLALQFFSYKCQTRGGQRWVIAGKTFWNLPTSPLQKLVPESWVKFNDLLGKTTLKL